MSTQVSRLIGWPGVRCHYCGFDALNAFCWLFCLKDTLYKPVRYLHTFKAIRKLYNPIFSGRDEGSRIYCWHIKTGELLHRVTAGLGRFH